MMPSPRIVAETDALLVLDKPTGLASASLPSGEGQASVVDWLEAEGRGEGIPERGLIHRLDTDTSGLLVVAKTLAEHTRLRALWSSHTVRKHYRALVSPRALEAGKAPPKALVDLGSLTLPHLIDYPIGHDAKSSKRMRALVESFHKSRIRGRAQPAITWIKALRICESKPGVTEAQVRIETGVQHQIRVHLSTIGYPILGDAHYHGAEFSRLALHAEELEFADADGSPLHFESELPTAWIS